MEPTTLYLLRHAPAEDSAPSGRDCDRPLSAEGTEKMKIMARGMRRLGLEPSMVVSSPYLRAEQTARLAVAALKFQGKIESSTALVPEASPAEIVAWLKRQENAAQAILLVGHDPHLSLLAGLLIGSPKWGAKVRMKKGSLARIEVEWIERNPTGELHFLLSPKQLVLLGEKAEA